MSGVELNLVQPAPGVDRFTVPLRFPSPDHLHVHVLDTPQGRVLIDTGAVGSEDALRAGLAALGPVPERVLITHAHVDHWGLATTLTDEVLAHPGVLPSLHWDDPTAGEYGPGAPTRAEMLDIFGTMASLGAGVPVIRELSHGDRLGDWEVLSTPGHDAGHICLYREADGILLCGDLLLPGFTPNVQPSTDGADALENFLASLQRMAALEVSLVLPAHGDAYTDHRGRARELAAHHEKRLGQLVAALADGPRSLGELRSAVFGATFAFAPDRLLADLETYAHLDHLRRRGLVTLEPDGRWSAPAV